MSFEIDPRWAVTVFLLWLRIGTVFVLSPVFSGLDKLVSVRVLFTLALSVLLVTSISGNSLRAPLTAAPLLLAAIGEVMLGAIMAFGVLASFGAFSLAGKILDVQSGFGLGSIFDPVTRAGSPLFSMMLNLLAVTVFFAIDGHHALMRGLAFSIGQVPPGSGLPALSAPAVIRHFGLMFSLGTALIAPVMFCLFLVEAGLAMMSRVLPQMNVFVVSIPIKIVAALAMFALTITAVGSSMGRVYASIFVFWEQVLS